jgi:hypothetical protein
MISEHNHDEAHQRMVLLAREIAIEFRTVDEILTEWGIARAEYDSIILTNPYFKNVLDAERAAWQAALNTETRIRLKAMAAVESLIPDLILRAANKHENLDYATKAVALLARLSGVSEKQEKGNGPAGEKFNIVIKIGREEKSFTKDITPKTETIEPAQIPAYSGRNFFGAPTAVAPRLPVTIQTDGER